MELMAGVSLCTVVDWPTRFVPVEDLKRAGFLDHDGLVGSLPSL
jgi:hypothetical protein